jgi:hypothetical protein
MVKADAPDGQGSKSTELEIGEIYTTLSYDHIPKKSGLPAFLSLSYLGPVAKKLTNHHTSPSGYTNLALGYDNGL